MKITQCRFSHSKRKHRAVDLCAKVIYIYMDLESKEESPERWGTFLCKHAKWHSRYKNQGHKTIDWPKRNHGSKCLVERIKLRKSSLWVCGQGLGRRLWTSQWRHDSEPVTSFPQELYDIVRKIRRPKAWNLARLLLHWSDMRWWTP